MELTLAITGASGTIYAHRTLQLLAISGVVDTVNLIMSATAATVAQVETGVNLKDPSPAIFNGWLGLPSDKQFIRYWRLDNFAAKPSSGSNKQAGMIIVPCSMGTLGAIASGAGTNLIHRAADVCLKEQRKLVLVPRETPYNAIHLENMLRLSRAGACIMPASPGFYHRPKTIDDLVEHLCFRILDQFDIPHSTKSEWTGNEVPHSVE
ncbi:MAG: UbiX family flavin prenyltransferase [Pyrinomonadaceae bacterium]